MHYPEPLYRVLPYLYMAAGVLSFFALPSPFRYISGGLLVIAGTMVMTMRGQKRANKAKRKPTGPARMITPGKK